MAISSASLKRSLAAALFPYREFWDRTNWNSLWLRTVKKARFELFTTRVDMYRYLDSTVMKSTPIDYLEFGVADGDSMRAWCGINSCKDSRFHGFDCFTGLPESWTAKCPKGTFNRDGAPPDIADARVAFHVGMFQDTLSDFLSTYTPANPIVVHNDSDLYSSTLYTLATLHPYLPVGTTIIFDEFWDVLHEYRALVDYCSAFRRRFEIVAATERCTQAAVRLLRTA